MYMHREIMLFIGKPKGRSKMISNAQEERERDRERDAILTYVQNGFTWFIHESFTCVA